MLHYELPDIEQPGQVLQSSVILDGFSHLGEKVTFKLSVCQCYCFHTRGFSFLSKHRKRFQDK